MALPAEQREVVVLRYLEELPPREIAARLGLAGGAVRMRLSRALATLRERLAHERHGDHRALGLALLLVARPALGGGAPFGALLMKTWTKLAAAVIALVGLGYGVYSLAHRPEAAGAAEQAVSMRPAAPPEDAEPRPAETLTAAAGESARHEVAVPEEPPSPPRIELHGRVLDLAGAGVGGVEVRTTTIPHITIEPEPEWYPLATTAPDGSFRCSVGADHDLVPLRLVVSDAAWITLLDTRLVDAEESEERMIYVVPARDYAGVVIDEGGDPLPGVPVRVAVDVAFLRSLRPGVERGGTPQWNAVTDETGAFALSRVGWIESSRLRVDYGGYEPISEPLPPASRDGWILTLVERRAERFAISGTVHDGEGGTLADVHVYWGELAARSDHRGMFLFELEAPPGAGTLRAAIGGYLPARRELAEGEATTGLELVLDRPALEITGRVLTPAGEPIANAWVWTHDGERLPRPTREHPRRLEEILAPRGDGIEDGRMRKTDDEGRFRLHGLLPRTYRVFALDPRTLEAAYAGPVTAPREDLRLFVGGEEALSRVAGRVVTYGGDPWPGVKVYSGRHRVTADGTARSPLCSLASPITDERGRFEFPALAIDGSYLLLGGEDVPMLDHLELASFPDLEEIEIELPAPCRLQVFLEQDPDEANVFMLLDDEENFLYFETHFDTYVSLGAIANIVGGRSEVIRADERAAWLVLMRTDERADTPGEEVRRVPVRLTPGEVTILRQ